MENINSNTEVNFWPEISFGGKIVVPAKEEDLTCVLDTPSWKWKSLGFNSYEEFEGWLIFNRLDNPNHFAEQYFGDFIRND